MTERRLTFVAGGLIRETPKRNTGICDLSGSGAERPATEPQTP